MCCAPSSRAPGRLCVLGAKPAGRSGDWDGDVTGATLPGFAVAEASPAAVGVAGPAPVRDYALVFLIDGGHVRAQTYAAFPESGPGVPCARDRLGAHGPVTRRLLRLIAATRWLTERPLSKRAAPVASVDAPFPPLAREPRPARAPCRRSRVHVPRVAPPRSRGDPGWTAGLTLYAHARRRRRTGTLGGVQTAAPSAAPAARAEDARARAGRRHAVVRRPGHKVGRINSRSARADVLRSRFDGTPSDLVAADDGTMWVVDVNRRHRLRDRRAGPSTSKDSSSPGLVGHPRAGNGALWYVDIGGEQGRAGDPAGVHRRGDPGDRRPSACRRVGPVDITPPGPGTAWSSRRSTRLVHVDAGGPDLDHQSIGRGSAACVHTNATGVWWIDPANRRIGRLRASVDRMGAAARVRHSVRLHVRL